MSDRRIRARRCGRPRRSISRSGTSSAKSLSAPVWRLLGGKVHASVPVYNTCAGYAHARATKRHALFERNEDWTRTPTSRCDSMRKGPTRISTRSASEPATSPAAFSREGIGAMKIWPFDVAAEASNGARITGAEIERALQPFRAIREAVGDEIEIMIELHGLWTLALRDGRSRGRWSRSGPPGSRSRSRGNDAGALAALAAPHRRSRSAPASGWRPAPASGDLLERGAASVAMIDVAWCGGLGEARRIADMADAWRVPVTLHDCTGPVVFAASCALSATLPHVNWQEMVRAYVHGWYREIVTALPQVTDGSVSPLEGAGLGLKLRPEIRSRPDAIFVASSG